MSGSKSVEAIHKMLTAARGDISPDAYLAPGGPFWCDDYVTAIAAADVHAALAAVRRDSIPSTARGAGLASWAAAILVPRKGATPARKAKALEVKGSPGAVVNAGERLQARRGGKQIRVNVDALIPASGVALLDVVSVDAAQARGSRQAQSLTL